MAVVIVLLIVVLVLLLAGSLVGLAFNLLWLVATGLVIGALGRLVLPGRHEISVLATALVGVGASLLGGILASLFDVGWLIQFLVAVALAAAGIALFASARSSAAARPSRARLARRSASAFSSARPSSSAFWSVFCMRPRRSRTGSPAHDSSEVTCVESPRCSSR